MIIPSAALACLLLAAPSARAEEDDAPAEAESETEAAPAPTQPRAFHRPAKAIRAGRSNAPRPVSGSGRSEAPEDDPREPDDGDEQPATGGAEVSAGEVGAPAGAPEGGAGIRQEVRRERRSGGSGSRAGGGGSGAGSGGGGSAAGGGGGGAGPFKGTFQISESLATMPKHAGAHGVMSFTPTSGYSVGFIPGPGGYCAAIDSPAAPAKDSCVADAWISEKPGGAALPGCASSGGLTTGGVFLPYGQKKSISSECVITRTDKRHYCNIVVTRDWTYYKDTFCGGLLNSPLGRPDLEPK